MITDVLKQYDIRLNPNSLKPYGNGLINSTYTIESDTDCYILQRINNQVFKQPQQLSHNLNVLSGHLQTHHPEYFLPLPIRNMTEDSHSYAENGDCFRLTKFVAGSQVVDVVADSNQAYQAALQFGQFTRIFSALDANQLQITIPQFHDLSYRFQQFGAALATASGQRLASSATLTQQLLKHANIANTYQQLVLQSAISLRTTHHDTKISNVLFNQANKGLCVIDLDTVMAGYFISDVGDMMRTYLCPEPESSTNWNAIHVRLNMYEAIADGYLTGIGNNLSENERAYFGYAGAFMIYMQALRFATDHLMNDVYYGATYPNENLMRAKNQLLLLEAYLDMQREQKGQK
ncbi:MAG: aminoglycoside phosphotransferase family protein, partial [Bacteroidetes bacterium]